MEDLTAEELKGEQKIGDEMFYALQNNGLTGDVASWLVDLALRLRRVEKQLNIAKEK